MASGVAAGTRPESLQDWLVWQSSRHPIEIDLGLDRLRPVAERLDVLQRDAFRIVVAGTNGKGSCACMLNAVLSQAGYRVGVYTSPHLQRYNERIVCLGEPASDDAIVASFERVAEACAATTLTYFEFGTLAALDLFRRARLDVEILEVGLGGRLDAVNVVDGDAALITPIGIDHEAWLGSDLESIGAEKAPVMRPGAPAVIADVDPPASLLNYARDHDVPAVLAGIDYHWSDQGDAWQWHDASESLSLPRLAMAGSHQMVNASACIALLRAVRNRLPVATATLTDALASAALPGRATRLQGDVEIMLDVAHNPAGARVLHALLRESAAGGATHLVIGMMKDKACGDIVDLLDDQADHWYVCELDDKRAASAGELESAVLARSPTKSVRQHKSVAAALSDSRARARPGDRIVVCGSFVTVAAAMSALENGGYGVSPGSLDG